MKQSIVIFVKNKYVDQIRRKFDPRFKKFKSHISLVYPFEIPNKKQVHDHVISSIKEIKKFEIVLKGLKKSAKEYYLYLLIQKGNPKIKLLHKNLNSGILKNFRNKDMPRYIPHISLGIFKSKAQIDNAIKELKKERIKLTYTVDRISLITLNKNNGIESVKNFKLSLS